MKGRGKKVQVKTGMSPTEFAFDPIDAALRQIHNQVAAEAIPDDFMRLLDQLGDGEATEGKSG